MRAVLKVFVVALCVLLVVCSHPIQGASIFKLTDNPKITNEEWKDRIFDIYIRAWKRAAEYTDLQKGEMRKIPVNAIHWHLEAVEKSVEKDLNTIPWNTDMFTRAVGRTFAYYTCSEGRQIRQGIIYPNDTHIQMYIKVDELLNFPDKVEGVLVHEMIHYIWHMRILNKKGWNLLWPDGHAYIRHLHQRGHNVPTGS